MTQAATLSPTPFGRVVTAMVTPFDASGAVDLSVAANLARHLVDQGSDGLLVCGTTGESPTLSWDEQLQLLQAVRDAVGSDAKVLAGTGSNSTAEAVEATKEAAADDIGVNVAPSSSGLSSPRAPEKEAARRSISAFMPREDPKLAAQPSP